MTHRLADGTPVVLGMRVRDYDRRYGVIEDSPANEAELKLEHMTLSSGEAKMISTDMDGFYTCEAWFYVRRDDGTKSSMDCSRMIAEGGRLDT
jgi:hypothetical protein